MRLMILVSLYLAFNLFGPIFVLIFKPHSKIGLTKNERRVFPTEGRLDADEVGSIDEIYSYIAKMAEFYSHKMKVFNLHHLTHEERNIKAIQLYLDTGQRRRKRGVLVVAGMNPMSVRSVTNLIDLIHRLLEVCAYKVPFLIDFNWFFIPIMNPDGYNYYVRTRNSWYKNRVPTNNTRCSGVSIDNNFGYHWGEDSDNADTCSRYYGGRGPFDQEENKALREFVLEYKHYIDMVIQLSQNTDGITYPWKHSKFEFPSTRRIRKLRELAFIASERIKDKVGIHFPVAQAGKLDHSSGSLVDWLVSIRKKLLVFTVQAESSSDLVASGITELARLLNSPGCSCRTTSGTPTFLIILIATIIFTTYL